MLDMTTPENTPAQRPRSRKSPRHRGKKKPEGLNAVQALKRAEPTVERVKGPAEEPLTEDEVRHLKEAFRFLKDHRSVLKLRVNASEDLLLNGKRDPTHRGVCQHLLSKVEKVKVLGASERLPPKEATALLAGVIRFSPELPYVMRFLECVQASAGQEQASAALTHALSRIDYEDISDAQVRQILSLIVEIFPEREQPAFLLSSLRTKAFRKAFDRSSEGLPPSLSKMLLPLREVHDLLHERDRRRRGGRQRQRQLNPSLLSEGAMLLLRVNQRCLLEFDAPVRRRLFGLMCDSVPEGDLPQEALFSLYRSLSFRDDDEKQRALLALVKLFLRVGLEKEAKRLLAEDAEQRRRKQDHGKAPTEGDKGPPSPSARLLALLKQPRVGSIAIDAKRPEAGNSAQQGALPPEGRFYHGVDLSTLKSVRVKWCLGDERTSFIQSAKLWSSVLLPQVCLPFALSIKEDAACPWVAVERFDWSLSRYLKDKRDLDLGAVALDLCRIENGVRALGLALPDGSLHRYSVDSADRMWLTDLSGVCAQEGQGTAQRPLSLVQSLRELAGLGLSFELDADPTALETCGGPLEIARLLRLID